MKTQFDKIYVLSLITNKDRQEFITYQFNQLGLDFEFVYGIDFYNFKGITWPDVNYYWHWLKHVNPTRNFGCTLTHYQAVMQAYYLGYNNVLILEDDVCLNINASLWEDMLNNIPNDADFVTYDPRIYNEDQNQQISDYINSSSKYVHIKNDFYICGGAMYGIMNRNTMNLYLDSQHQHFVMSDHVEHFFEDINIENFVIDKRYIPTECLFVDQFTYNKWFIHNDATFMSGYNNNYVKYKKYSKDDFFMPNKWLIESRKVYE